MMIAPLSLNDLIVISHHQPCCLAAAAVGPHAWRLPMRALDVAATDPTVASRRAPLKAHAIWTQRDAAVGRPTHLAPSARSWAVAPACRRQLRAVVVEQQPQGRALLLLWALEPHEHTDPSAVVQ
jgi:hypothetical protein